MVLSFICWVIVVALFCVAVWRIACRHYTEGLNVRLLKRYRRVAARRYAVYFVPERLYDSVPGPSYKVYERGCCKASWDTEEQAVKYCKALQYEYIQDKLRILRTKYYYRKRVF